jgi:hypothetical protein
MGFNLYTRWYFICLFFSVEVSSIHVSSNFFAEEVSQQKLATQYICRELHEADEPNLLDEEGNFRALCLCGKVSTWTDKLGMCKVHDQPALSSLSCHVLCNLSQTFCFPLVFSFFSCLIVSFCRYACFWFDAYDWPFGPGKVWQVELFIGCINNILTHLFSFHMQNTLNPLVCLWYFLIIYLILQYHCEGMLQGM